MSDRPSVRITHARPGSVRITLYNEEQEVGVTLTLAHLSQLAHAANHWVACLAGEGEERPLDAATADTIVTEAYRTNPPEKGKPGAVFAWMRELHRQHPGVDVDEMIATYNRIRNTGAGLPDPTHSLVAELTRELRAGGPAVTEFADVVFPLMESAEYRAYPDTDLDDLAGDQEDESPSGSDPNLARSSGPTQSIFDGAGVVSDGPTASDGRR